FTMSLFIGLLAFANDAALQDAVKVGILAGSIVSALLGISVLLVAQLENTTRIRPDTVAGKAQETEG
ncbi:hypothetical protein EOD29_30570, partial [Mesorhizobium sp. M1A.T.Ca.IN.004.03.1.1]